MPQINLQNIGNNITSNINQIGTYLINGLTVTSNNPQIVPRDKSGTVNIKENLPLIIEPTTYRISKKSILKVVDTQFNFYNFPVSVNTTILDNIDEFNLNNDLVFARYKPLSDQTVSANGFFPPAGNAQTFFPRGIELSEVVGGTFQSKPNSYYVTKEIKESGVDLRIRAKIKHKFNTFGDTSNAYGQFAVWIAQGGPNIGFEGVGGGRTKYGPFAKPGETVTAVPPTYTASDVIQAAITYANSSLQYYQDQQTAAAAASYGNPYGPSSNVDTYTSIIASIQTIINSLPDDASQVDEIISDTLQYNLNQLTNINIGENPYDIQRNDLITKINSYTTYLSELQQNASAGNIGLINGAVSEQQTRYIDFVVPNANFEIGDYFSITADSDSEQPGFREHTIIADETYFVVTDASKNVDVWNQEL